MKNRTIQTLIATLALSVASLFSASPAAAVSTTPPACNLQSGFPYGAMLVFSCTLGGHESAALLDHASGLCGVEPNPNNHSICKRLSGDPWVCNERVGPTGGDDEECGKLNCTLTFSATLSLPTGWSLEGSINATIDYKAELKNVKTCLALAKSDPPKGEAGEYVNKTGRLTVNASLTFTGEAKLKNPALGISTELKAGCDASAPRNVYATEKTDPCGSDSCDGGVDASDTSEGDETDGGSNCSAPVDEEELDQAHTF